MGRIEHALRQAETSRDRARARARHPVRAITIEHLSGEARGFRRRFLQSAIMIGRGDHNDVPFDPFDDPTVSSQHAEIRIEGEDVLLYDMGSLNGCYVGERRYRRVRLEDGCELALGRRGPRLRIEIGDWSEAGGPLPPRRQDADREAAPQPDTAEAALASRGVFSRSESLILVAVLAAIVLDVALSLARGL